MSYSYTEWLCHTNFSFLVGASHPGEIFDQASKLGLSGLAITDFDGVYGLARSYRHWRDLDSSKRPKMFYGAELHLSPDQEKPIVQQNTISLIAKTAKGYENLCRLITHSHRNGKYSAFVSIEDLESHSLEDLAAILPMRGMIRFAPRKLWYQQLSQLKELFSQHLYLAFSRHLNPAEDVWMRSQWEASQHFQTKVLLSQDVFFHSHKRKPLSDTLHAIRTNTPLADCVEHMFANDQRVLLSPSQFHQRYKSLPFYEEALRYSSELADECHFSFAELRYNYPKEMIPSHHSPQSFLEELVQKGALAHYKDGLPTSIQKTLRHELDLIQKLNFADYFLTVWDIVSWARSQDILCQGRGSAANSAVCFVLGITSVDPAKFDLLFERFISVERGDPPDIDVDFENERREEVIQYIYRRYGRNKAAMVANVITFRRKGALRETGKALGIPNDLLGSLSERIGSRVLAGKSMAEITLDLQADCSEHQDLPWKLWLEIAQELKGFPRHLGIHSGGFMLSDSSLNQLVPQEPATMEGRTVVQWCKDDIEELGFFKIDLLALGMLTAIRKMFQMLKKDLNVCLNMSTIPHDDPDTYSMIQRADTIGTFQIESRAQMSMLPRLRPKTLYDLVIEVAIIRPGPIQGGMVHPFLRRRNGLEPIQYPDERLRPILERTLGIPIFQEQVMRIAMAVGNFTPGEANELRKNMGAWSMRGDINPWLTKLAEGLRMNNISQEFEEAIIAQMKGFAEYGFPESHSVSFAMIAYASSYLKCHYPAVFFACILNSQPMGFYSPHSLLQAAKHGGVSVLPISINHSFWDSTLEFQDSQWCIRLGFRLIAGMKESTAKTITDLRQKHGIWKNWEIFLQQTGSHLFRHELVILAAADALAPLGIDRRYAIWMSVAAPHSSWLKDIESPLDLPKENIHEKVQQDLNATGTSLFAHPAELVRGSMWFYPIDKKRIKLAKDVAPLIPNQIIHVFGMITIVQRPPSAKGMMFITLEDETGYLNLAFTPQTIDKFAKSLTGKSMLCISGKLQKQDGATSILVKEVFDPRTPEAEILPFEVPEHPPLLPYRLEATSIA